MSDLTKFLSLLAPSSTPHLFLTFLDSPKVGHEFEGVDRFVGSIEDLAAELTFRNEVGCGVFVAINEPDGADPYNRKRENIRRIRAVWQDDDKGWSGELPLEPSLVVETSPGKFHRYWLVEDDWATDVHGRAEFHRTMAGMAKNYGCDPSAKDLSRVLRVPGFWHRKGKPFLVRIVGGNDRRYTREDIVKAFALPPSEHRKSEPVADADWGKERGRVLNALEHIPADCDYHKWLTVGMALHWITGGSDEGLDIWRGWSGKAPPGKYPDQKSSLEKHWRGFSTGKQNLKTVASLYGLALKYGWEDPIGRDLVQVLPLSELPEIQITVDRSEGSLTSLTMQEVRKKFAEYDHRPSAEQFEGLEQVVASIEAMAKQDQPLGQDLLVSYLPPGTGKTTVVAEAVRTLTQMDEHRDVGVIIFLFRVDQIRDLARSMGLSEADYSVICSARYEESRLGNPQKTEARVMFTTQQMLDSKVRRAGSFAAITDFHWNGRPRQVRIWDEAISPTSNHTLGHFAINDIAKDCAREGKGEFADALLDFSQELRRAPEGSIVAVPDISAHEVSLEQMLGWVRDVVSKSACAALDAVSGRTVRVRRDQYGNSALHYEDKLPLDIGPMVILDASGQHRKVYEFWHRDRKGLAFLKSPKKDYSGLTIRHWNRGAGKQTLRTNWQDIVDGVVRAIDGIPEEEPVLVIHSKPKLTIPDVADEIKARLNGRENVSFCTWGRHTATNEFASIKHVILVSVLQYSTSQIEAMARGAKGIGTEDELSDTDFTAVRLGEIAHNLFQGACRGNVRKSVGSGCPQGCHLYIIISTKGGTGIPRDLLGQVFPGARIEDWKPVLRLKGNAKKLFDLMDGAGEMISKQELLRELGFKNASQLSPLLKHPEFVAAMNEKYPGWTTAHFSIIKSAHSNISSTEKSITEIFKDMALPF